MTIPLVLASQSPRRKALLTQMGYEFSCIPADINEDIQPNESAITYVERLAIEKAETVIQNLSVNTYESCIVLGSDTSVVFQDNILGKPSNFDDKIKISASLKYL